MNDAPRRRLLVTGSQDWDNAAIVWLTLERMHRFDPDILLVTGACPRGADLLCETYWEHLGGGIERHPAAWYASGQYDGMAGIRRNQEMVDLGAWGCLAFGMPCERRTCAGKPADADWPFHVTHGTGQCSRYAKARGIAVRRVTPVSPARR